MSSQNKKSRGFVMGIKGMAEPPKKPPVYFYYTRLQEDCQLKLPHSLFLIMGGTSLISSIKLRAFSSKHSAL